MTRFCFLLLLIPLFGCQPPVPATTLKPVKVDEAAAYPSQEPGTKPPILTGFSPLTKEQLDEGWIQLFDGISTFGWVVTEGEGTLSVMTDGTKNYLVFDKDGKNYLVFNVNKYEKPVTISHRFGMYKIENTPGFIVYGGGSQFRFDGSQEFSSQCDGYGHNEVRIKLIGLHPLTESDWKPAAGKCEAKWTDGVLELTGGSGMVETVQEYGDFVLQLEYFTDRVADNEGINGGINSGVFFRCIPGENMNGYECQIFNAPPDDDYKNFIGTDTGGIFRRQVGRNVGPKDGEWNYLTLAVRGADVATWVNGIQVTDWTDMREEHPNPRNGKRLQPGTIQLQGHDPTTKILFRNIRIAELK